MVHSHFQLHRETFGVKLGLSIKCIGCVLFRGWLCVHWAGHKNCVASALTRTSRFQTRVFSKMHKMSSVALPPKKQSVLIDPRYIILMLRPQSGHAIRRLRLVLNKPPVVCEQDFGAPCPIDWVLVDNIFNDSLQYCTPGDSHDGPCADQAFSFDGWPSERKVD